MSMSALEIAKKIVDPVPGVLRVDIPELAKALAEGKRLMEEKNA